MSWDFIKHATINKRSEKLLFTWIETKIKNTKIILEQILEQISAICLFFPPLARELTILITHSSTNDRSTKRSPRASLQVYPLSLSISLFLYRVRSFEEAARVSRKIYDLCSIKDSIFVFSSKIRGSILESELINNYNIKIRREQQLKILRSS